jgi:hypothetical protein
VVIRIGITGHTRLPRPTASRIRLGLSSALARYGAVHGVTCLAEGADQIFAEAVLAGGGSFDVILPAANYRAAAVRHANRRRFDVLISSARQVVSMPFERSGDEAFAAANEALVGQIDRLIAVWDGVVDGHPGSTAHAVAQARNARVPVTRLWPVGARRLHRPPEPVPTTGVGLMTAVS